MNDDLQNQSQLFTTINDSLFQGEADEVLAAFKSLSISDGSVDNAATIDLLKKLSQHAGSKAAAIEGADVTASFTALLKRTDLNASACDELYRTIAEITKLDSQRTRFTDETIVDALLKCLADRSKQANGVDLRTQQYASSDFLTAIQLCRALGNICYNNEDARNVVLKLGGDHTILNLLDIRLDAGDEVQVSFAKYRGGLVSNYLLGGEHLAKNALELNLLARLERLLGDCVGDADVQPNEDFLMNALQPLSLLTENVSDLRFSPKTISYIAQVLTVSKDPEVAEMCLEMLNYQAENGKCVCVCVFEGALPRRIGKTKKSLIYVVFFSVCR